MRLCFLGDSFVNGAGDADGLGWVGRLCRQERQGGADLTSYNLGVRGDTSSLVADRWYDEAARRLTGIPGAARVIFCFGVNDACPPGPGAPGTGDPHRRLSEAASEAAVRACLSGARAVWPVLMVGPPPIADAAINRRVERLDRRFAAIAAASGVPYLSVFAILAEDAVWCREVAATDGAHPGAPGYERLAALVAAWSAWRAWFDGAG